MEVDILPVNTWELWRWVIYLLMSGYCGGRYFTCKCPGTGEVGISPCNVLVLWRWRVFHLSMSG